jgi:hypothetical protein
VYNISHWFLLFLNVKNQVGRAVTGSNNIPEIAEDACNYSPPDHGDYNPGDTSFMKEIHSVAR